MAIAGLSPLPFDGFTATALVANARALGQANLSPSFAPYANTKEIVILNRDTVNFLLVKCIDISAQTASLPDIDALAEASSTVILPGDALTLSIGVAGERGHFYTGAIATDRLAFAIQADTANIVFNCTYIQALGN